MTKVFIEQPGYTGSGYYTVLALLSQTNNNNLLLTPCVVPQAQKANGPPPAFVRAGPSGVK